MCKILIFGGTTEGRQLAEFCAAQRMQAYVSVATEYGGELLGSLDTALITVLTGRKDENEIADWVERHHIETVLDATHPYAVEAGKNIAAACRRCRVRYIRILRESGDFEQEGHYFASIDEVIAYLNAFPEGNILLTTGSKQLAEFCRIRRFAQRCAVRVLPAEGILEKCAAYGLAPDRVIAAKGPFSHAQNVAHLRRYDVKYLVTKESGRIGGLAEKVSAARECGAELLILRRPQESGISLQAAEEFLITEYSHECKS